MSENSKAEEPVDAHVIVVKKCNLHPTNFFLEMANLPFEIWLLIVQHLPAHQVRNLYSVNRALFNIALDLRYQDAFIGVLPDRVVLW